MSKTIIKNGRILSPANQVDIVGNLCIEDNTIVALGETPDGFTEDTSIDATDCIVMPGLIDLSVSLREPGYEHKGSIEHETRAAAKGGITTVCATPNTAPIADSPAVIELILDKATHAPSRVLPIGALTKDQQGETLAEMAALKKAGCIAVSNVGHPIQNTRVLQRAFEYAASYDLTVIYHAEDSFLAHKGMVHEGLYSASLGLPGIPASAETVAVATALQLQKETGVQLHFARLSAESSLELLKQAQNQGQTVTADVAIHQLLLTDQDITGFNAYCHVRPPLRTLQDQKALRQALNEGVITAICSDHQPHESTAKIAPFMATEPGISGVETLLSLSNHLVEEKVIDIKTLINLLSYQPAEVIGQPELGQLKEGGIADVCVFDPNSYWQLDKTKMLSQGLNTPFLDWPLSGQVKATLSRGRLVYQLERD